eukprot:scaffold127988_cov30-Tisochrysis_lutea.AAC.3
MCSRVSPVGQGDRGCDTATAARDDRESIDARSSQLLLATEGQLGIALRPDRLDSERGHANGRCNVQRGAFHVRTQDESRDPL